MQQTEATPYVTVRFHDGGMALVADVIETYENGDIEILWQGNTQAYFTAGSFQWAVVGNFLLPPSLFPGN